jgi:hypothetical protein
MNVLLQALLYNFIVLRRRRTDTYCVHVLKQGINVPKKRYFISSGDVFPHIGIDITKTNELCMSQI